MIQAIVNSIGCDDLADIFREAGFRASLEKGASGRSYITFGSNGYNCYVYFYGENPEQSGLFEKIIISFGIKYDDPVPYEVANKWNADMISSRAYINDTGAIRLDYTMIFAGGTTRDNIVAVLKQWDRDAGRFINHVDRMIYKKPGTTETAKPEVPAYDKSRLN
jgi:hypothetical protein